MHLEYPPQVPCISAFKAPPGCLQYHTASSGIVESFNLRGMNKGRPATALFGPGGPFAGVNNPNNINNPFPFIPPNNNPLFLQGQNLVPNPNYFNRMNYGVCIAQQPKTCGIRWE